MLIDYDLPLWRPPSEARSLILQATLGCSHNECTFCYMYKTKRFRARPVEEVVSDMERVARAGLPVRRIFLADGDALVLPADRLLRILETARSLWPDLERVSCYATPQNLLRKSVQDLARLRAAGLTLLYYGVESGSDEVLEAVRKGATAAEILEAGSRAHEAGMDLSCTVLLGLAGPGGSRRHAEATGRLLSDLDPRYAAALTVMEPDPWELRSLGLEPLGDDEAPWRQMGPWEVIEELKVLLEHFHPTDCLFRTNHASNYLPIGGHLPGDRADLLAVLEEVLRRRDPRLLRSEGLRGL